MQRYGDGSQEGEKDNMEVDIIVENHTQLGNEEYFEREIVGLTF